MATKNKALTEEQKHEIRQVVIKQVWIGLSVFFVLLSGILGLSLWDIKSRVEKKVENLVAQQFEEPRIKEIVENSAKNKASALMSEQINPEVIKFKEDIAQKLTKADEKLSEIDARMHDVNQDINTLDLYSQFSLTVSAAQGDYRPSYDQLYKWASDDSFPLQGLATRAYQKIMDDHSGLSFNTISEIKEPNKLTFEQLTKNFSDLDPYKKRALLKHILERNDIPKKERLDFFADVLKNDDDLMVCEFAGRYFTNLTGLKVKPLALDYLIKWWDDNKDAFEKSPDPN